MKKNNLILGAFLAITAILFSSFGAYSSSDNTSTEKGEGSIESTESGGVVTIGSQVWSSKNLDVSTYSNGDVIPQVQDQEAWQNLTTGAWCYYDNDASNGTKYGKLYNFYAVNDPRGLAPKGFHIPNDAEWSILTDNLGGDYEAGTKMKGSTGWYKKGNGTNSSGFSGLPGGYRANDGTFNDVRKYGYWWSSSESNTSNAWYRNLYYYDGNVYWYYYDKSGGISVRCLRD